MDFSLYQQINYPLSLLSCIGGNAGLYHDSMGLSLFFLFFLLVLCCFSAKAIIFVLLMHYRKGFVLSDLQYDKRNFTAGFQLNRLLQFTRAVHLPPRQVATVSVWGEEEIGVLYNTNSFMWLLVRLFLS